MLNLFVLGRPAWHCPTVVLTLLMATGLVNNKINSYPSLPFFQMSRWAYKISPDLGESWRNCSSVRLHKLKPSIAKKPTSISGRRYWCLVHSTHFLTCSEFHLQGSVGRNKKEGIQLNNWLLYTGWNTAWLFSVTANKQLETWGYFIFDKLSFNLDEIFLWRSRRFIYKKNWFTVLKSWHLVLICS